MAKIRSQASSTVGAKPDWARLGVDAARAGDFANAIDLFVTAISHDQRNAGLRYNLAIALERNGEIDDAAVSLSDALRIKPGMTEAADRLGRVLGRYDIAEPGRLDQRGLLNALNAAPEVGEPVGRMLMRILRLAGPLRDALEAGALDGFAQTARDLVGRRTGPLLRDTIFLRA
ncbi:MAG: tetratricopeptide repeat protein, partial [Pseudomonadota bacterium]